MPRHIRQRFLDEPVDAGLQTRRQAVIEAVR